MAAVYAATDRVSGRRVAIKRLHANSDPRSAELFEREYRTLASLHHPCIVEVYEYGKDADGAYYTMELLEGRDISHSAPMPWREVCACLRDVAAILGVLHARRLVHRDLSPRNLWRTPEGILKMIDFGAVTPFGVANEIVGTPAFVAPETLEGKALDARTDLFSLGALGYWLLADAHAFYARRLDELPLAHQTTPAPPSKRLSTMRPDLEPPPQELDALILRLLRLDPRERVASTSELVDRLGGLAELAPEAADTATVGYLASQQLVGRERELEEVERCVMQAREGHGRALWLEGEAGAGHTRMLKEARLVAQLAGATCVLGGARDGGRAYGLAEALTSGLLDAFPGAARDAAAQGDFPALSPLLQARMGLPIHTREHDGRAARIRTLAGLQRFVLGLASERPIVLLVDAVDAVDEPSQALLAGLALGCADSKLVIVATARAPNDRPLEGSLRALREAATRLPLTPLSVADTKALLSSVFADAPHVERVAQWLQRASEGNPQHCLRLVQHLIDRGLVRYGDGMWVLPREVSASDLLPRMRRDGTQLDRLSPEARALARRLSLPRHHTLERLDCVALAEVDEQTTSKWLAELERGGVLREPADQGRFVDVAERMALQRELGEVELARAHLRLADALLVRARAGSDEMMSVHVAYHLMRGGELQRGYALLASLFQRDQGLIMELGHFAAIFEELYELLVARGASDETLSVPLGVLAIAGYLVDHRLSRRFGEEAISCLERVLKVSLARRLRPWLGAKLALLLALGLAAVGLWRKRPLAPRLKEAIVLYVSGCSALCGTAATYLDPAGAARHAKRIEPFTALGKNHAAAIVHAFSENLAQLVRGRRAHSQQLASRLLDRLTNGVPVRALRNDQHEQYVRALLYCRGVNARFRDDTEVLTIADQLEERGALSVVNANHLRASYYAGQGDSARASHYRKQVELAAIQLGSTWQTETWAPADDMTLALRTHDALLMKRAAEELTRLAATAPSLALVARHAQGMHLLLRGQYLPALDALNTGDAPVSHLGWGRSRSALARAYNGLGRHQDARAVALDALGYLDDDDLTYTRMHLGLLIELALAEAALGEITAGARRIDDLLIANTVNSSPLTMAALHEARARIALLGRDYGECRKQLELLGHWIEPLGIPTLLERRDAVYAVLEATHGRQAAAVDAPAADERVVSALHTLLASEQHGARDERARMALLYTVQALGASTGFVLLGEERAPAAQLSEVPEPVLHWARQHSELPDLDEMSTALAEQDATGEFVDAELRYRAFTLVDRVGHADAAVGVLVLGAARPLVSTPSALLLRAIASHLAPRAR